MSRMAKPSHPGQFIRMEILELNARASLSSEMALRIEKAFGVKMDTLLRMQTSYEIAEARSHEHEINIGPYVARPKTPSPTSPV